MSATVTLNDVLARTDVWRGRLVDAALPALSSGFPALDAELPGGGWPRGALTELLVDASGYGECSLLRPVFEAVRTEARWLILIAPPHVLHAPAWIGSGADGAHLVVIAPESPRDLLWAAEQSLSVAVAGAVLCWADAIVAAQTRRLQVAASAGKAPCFLFRPRRACAENSAAPLRLALSSGSRGTLGVDVIKRRGPPLGRTLFLDVARPSAWRGKQEAHDPGVVGIAPAELGARSPRPRAVA